jgi:hypothetical protein
MTENKAKKNDVRRRMAQTGEPYNVARRSIETASSPGSHLIADEETRRIAESFLAASSWLGSLTWQDIVVGLDAEYLAEWDGTFDPKKSNSATGSAGSDLSPSPTLAASRRRSRTSLWWKESSDSSSARN